MLYRALRAGAALVESGERDPKFVAGRVADVVDSEPLARLDYAEVVDAAALEQPGVLLGEVRLLVAAHFGDVRLIDLTAAYGALATEGQLSAPFAITKVLDTQGDVLYQHGATPPRQVLSAQHAYQVADILSDPNARIPGFGEVTPLDTPFKAAVKTGTTSGFKDNWTLGFTPGLAVGVWVGNADNTPMQDVSGVDGAGPLWRDVMEAAVGNSDPGWLQRPAGLLNATVCAPTGLLPGPDCPSPVTDLFVAGTVPSSTEQYYSRSVDGQLLVNPPPEARAWALDSGLALAPAAAGSAAGPGGGLLQLVTPPPGSVYYLSPELQAQQLMLRATAPPGTKAITFAVDGQWTLDRRNSGAIAPD